MPAGDASLHYSCRWHDPVREYRLCVAYSGTDDAVADKYKRSCDKFFRVQGPKWPIIRAVMSAWDLNEFEYVWLPDDDLEVSPEAINTMFRTAAKYRCVRGLGLPLPSLPGQCC